MSSSSPEVVDPSWILKALGAVLAVGLLFAYLSLCAFFYWGQSQILLHPSRTVAATPATEHLGFKAIRFGADASGQPQLAGWWIPAADGSANPKATPTVLLLHGASGSRSEALAVARALHDAHLGVLLFDYRGYGDSAGGHPTQATMQEDAEAAWQFLTQSRRLTPGSIVVLGQDLATSLAVHLAATHREIPGVILLDADGDTASRVEADQRSLIVPVGMLFHERFPLADPLHSLLTPKLLLGHSGAAAPRSGGGPEIARRAADPKVVVDLGQGTAPAALTEAVRQFLARYLPGQG